MDQQNSNQFKQGQMNTSMDPNYMEDDSSMQGPPDNYQAAPRQQYSQ
jgi:hypothetical protein